MIGKIYKITGGGKTYIGSTIHTLENRLRRHKTEKRLRPHKNCASFELLDYDDCCISLIEEINYNSIEELLEREKYWYNSIDNVNIKTPLRTLEEKKQYYKEWNKTNKDKIKGYYEKKKEQIKQRVKDYQHRLAKCDICNIELKQGSLRKHKKSQIHLLNENNISV